MELKHHVKGGSIKRIFYKTKVSTGGQTGALGSLSSEVCTQGPTRAPTGRAGQQ